MRGGGSEINNGGKMRDLVKDVSLRDMGGGGGADYECEGGGLHMEVEGGFNVLEFYGFFF